MITTGNVVSGGGALRKYIENSVIRNFKKNTFFYDMGEQRTLSSGDNKYTFNLADKDTASVANVTLTEGTTPAEAGYSFRQVEVSMSQYGRYYTISDLAAKDNPFPLAEEAGFELGRLMAEIVDDIVQTTLNTSTNVTVKNASDANIAASALVAADTFKAKRIAEAVAKLQNDAVDTIGGSYVAVMHPYVQSNLLTESAVGGFIDLAKYQASEKIFNGEIGKLYGVKIVVANNLKTVGTATGGALIYPTFIMGAKAYTVVTSQNMETIINPFGSAGSADPLKQRMTVGVKIRFGTALLKTESLQIVKSAAIV